VKVAMTDATRIQSLVKKSLADIKAGDFLASTGGSDAGGNSPVVLVLPDNSRDPELTCALRDTHQQHFARKRSR
jgi:hypothetical protein